MPVRSEQILSPLRASSVQYRAPDTTIELYNENAVTTITLGGGTGLTSLALDAGANGLISLLAGGGERLRVLNNGNVQVGESIGAFSMDAANLMLANNGGQTPFRVRLANATPGNGPAVTLQRSRGVLTAPTAVTTDDLIAQWVAQGYIGPISGHSVMARVEFLSDGVPVDNVSAPGRISFMTTPSGSLLPVENWRIPNTGHLLAGADGTYDIGAAGATRPRDLHLSRYLLIGGEWQPIILSKTSVDLKVVGTTNLFTVPVGRSLVVAEVFVRPTTATAANGDAVAGVGVAAGEDDIFPSQTLTGLNLTTERFKFPSSGVSYVAQATEIVRFGVDTADTGTALVADVYLVGYLI